MKTRSKAKLGDTIDLLSDEDPMAPKGDDDDDMPKESSKPHQEGHQIGDVGYTFEKRFNKGWFTGKVIEIRPGAANGKDRRCQYEDGDMEDMSLVELKRIERKARRHTETPKVAIQPEQVTSSEFIFNEKDYNELRVRYLTQKVLENQQLPSGMTLRRTYRDKYIDRCGLGFKKLREEIESLQKANKDVEIYKLLSQLKDWDINPKRTAIWRSLGIADDDDVNELLDLTTEDEKVCVDVDVENEEVKPDHIEPVCSVSEKGLVDLHESVVEHDNQTNQNRESVADQHVSSSSVILSNVSLQTAFDHEVVADKCSIISPEKPSSDYNQAPEPVHSGPTTCNKDGVINCRSDLHPSTPVPNIFDVPDSDDSNLTKSTTTYDQLPSIGPTPDCVKSSVVQTHTRDSTFDDTEKGRHTSCFIKLTPNAIKAMRKHMLRQARSILINDYRHLEKRYLIPKVKDKSKLANGMVIRKQRKERYIDQPTPRFKKLQRRIDSLLKEKKTQEVHLILSQLHQWENDPNENAIWQRLGVKDDDDDEMIVDLTNEVDLDHHFTAKNEIKVKHNANETITSQTASIGAKSIEDIKTDHPDNMNIIGGKKFEAQQVTKLNCLDKANSSSSSSDWCSNNLQASTQWQQPACSTDYGDALKRGYATKKEAATNIIGIKRQQDDCTLGIQASNIDWHKPPSTTNTVPSVVLKPGYNLQAACNSIPPKTLINTYINAPASLPIPAPAAKIEFKRDQCESVSTISDTSRSNNSLSTHYYQSKRAGLELLATTADAFGKDKKVSFMKQLTGNRDYTTPNTTEDYNHLADGWRTQGKRRRKGEWTPNGHVTGKWKAPQWKDGDLPHHSKPATCKKVLLPILERLVNDFIKRSVPQHKTKDHTPLTPTQLCDIVCPFYLKPDLALLESAHYALETLLPEGDCESFDVVRISRNYCNYWRPKQTRVILLAESHAATDRYAARHNTLDECIIPKTRYRGPREFLSLVYCLSYGENESMRSPISNNKGTPQFWSLLAACSRGVDYIPTQVSASKQTASRFAADILKGGGLRVEDRLNAKLEVLEDLRERGIWLIDTSIFGWYISQPQQYKRSSVSNEVHRMQKERPPGELKSPSLVLSYELFTKHLIREIAEEGHLQLLIPIGRDVERAITREKLEDAIRIPGINNHARVVNAFPAPNAWIPGGYGLFHAKLADLIHSVAPRKDLKSPSLLKVKCTDGINDGDDDTATKSELPNPMICPSLPPLTG